MPVRSGSELKDRDKLHLDLTSLKDESTDDCFELDATQCNELAGEMIQDLQNAPELLGEIAQVVKKRPD